MSKMKHYFKWVTSKRYRKHLWLRVHLSAMRDTIHVFETIVRIMGPGEIYRVLKEGPWRTGRINKAILSRARELVKEAKDDH